MLGYEKHLTRLLKMNPRYWWSHILNFGGFFDFLAKTAFMSMFPGGPLVDRVRGLIVETFEVSERDAQEQAALLVALAEGWGDSSKAGQIDWSYRVRKDLNKKFRWRSEAEREKFESGEKQKFAAYEGYIRNQKRSS